MYHSVHDSPEHNRFIINGHYCQIKREWSNRTPVVKGYINGELIAEEMGRQNTVREELLTEAKYREQTHASMHFGGDAYATYAVITYLRGINTWVLEETIDRAIFPEDNGLGGAYPALLDLQENGDVESIDVFTGLDATSAWRLVR